MFAFLAVGFAITLRCNTTVMHANVATRTECASHEHSVGAAVDCKSTFEFIAGVGDQARNEGRGSGHTGCLNNGRGAVSDECAALPLAEARSHGAGGETGDREPVDASTAEDVVSPLLDGRRDVRAAWKGYRCVPCWIVISVYSSV